MILQVAKRIANVRFTEEKGKNWTKFAGFLPFFQILTFCKKRKILIKEEELR